MRATRLAPLLLAAALAAGACSPMLPNDAPDDSVRVGYVTRDGDRVSGTGTLEWFALEGGFFAIRGDDGKVYDPMNLPPAFARAGARVRFEARIRADMAGIHGVGEIVELTRVSAA